MSTASTTSYSFQVLNFNGSVFGKGCFTYEGTVTPVNIAYSTDGKTASSGPKLTAFFYHDYIVGTMDLSQLQSLQFTDGNGAPRFAIELWSSSEHNKGLSAGTATPTEPGAVAVHQNMQNNFGAQGRKLEFPKKMETTTTTEEGKTTIPAVDLVVVIDSSTSMKDEADSLSKAVSAAIEAAKTSCPSDLRVAYLGIEGTFGGTRFDTTVRSYLTQTAKVAESALKQRKKGTVKEGGAQEDGARAVEDITTHFDWRPGAQRAIFFLGDEGFEGGGKVDQEDIASAEHAIGIAKAAGVRVHTYLGTSSVKAKALKELEAQFAGVAKETGGQAFTSKDALSGFQGLLEKVICGSKTDPRTTTTDACCCKQHVEELPPTKPDLPIKTGKDEIYAISFEGGSLGDAGDIYAHRSGSCELVRKVIDTQPGPGWSNAISPDGVHYIGWCGNQIYAQREGEKIQYMGALSGGAGKDGFAFRKDGPGYFFSGYAGGLIYWFTDPSKYSTLQVTNAPGNQQPIFTGNNWPFDMAFDADDRAFFIDWHGYVWVVEDTRAESWVAKYVTQFGPPAAGTFMYYGMAFDSEGAVYMCGGSNGRRFIVKSSFDNPKQVEMVYLGALGSGSYGNLSSREYPRLKLKL